MSSPMDQLLNWVNTWKTPTLLVMSVISSGVSCSWSVNYSTFVVSKSKTWPASESKENVTSG